MLFILLSFRTFIARMNYMDFQKQCEIANDTKDVHYLQSQLYISLKIIELDLEYIHYKPPLHPFSQWVYVHSFFSWLSSGCLIDYFKKYSLM